MNDGEIRRFRESDNESEGNEDNLHFIDSTKEEIYWDSTGGFGIRHQTTKMVGANGETLQEWHPCGCFMEQKGDSKQFTVCREHEEEVEDVIRGG